MQTEAMSLGFVGGGVNSAVGRSHFIASQMDGRFKVVAGCFSRHEEVNTRTAEQWGVPQNRCYKNSGELLENEQGRLSAIVVLTPTPDHAPLVIQALREGFPVICEKSLASSSADVLEIKRTVCANAGFLAVTYNYTGYPMLRELKSLIGKAVLGQVKQIHVEMPQEGFVRLNRQGEPMKPQDWRLRDGVVPTLSLDLGSHVHHLIHFLIDETPLELVAHQSSLGLFRQVADNMMCMVRYSGDVDCSIWFSKSALGHRNGLRVRVFGDQGSAEWYQFDPEFLIVNDNKGRRTVVDRASVDVDVAAEDRYGRFKAGHPAGYLEAFANLYGDIADDLAEHLSKKEAKSEYVFDVDDALEGIVMLEAMSASARASCWKSIHMPKL